MGLQQRGVESRLLVHDGTPIEAGLRELETYAVRCGGGVNHRMGLDDAAKLTENHRGGSDFHNCTDDAQLLVGSEHALHLRRVMRMAGIS